jgi:hypothetical protein
MRGVLGNDSTDLLTVHGRLSAKSKFLAAVCALLAD